VTDADGAPLLPGPEPGKPELGTALLEARDAPTWRRWATPERWAVVLALVPAVSAVAVLGRLHPDEVYQFLEPAFFKVHGYGVLAWEWRQGLRNWAAPLVLAGLLKVGAGSG